MSQVLLPPQPAPLAPSAGWYRPDPAAFEAQTQQRLFIDRFQLVQAPAPRFGEVLWALPGGGRASTAQLLVLARRRGWKRPRVVDVTVRHPLVAVPARRPAAGTARSAMLPEQGSAG